MIAMYAHRLSLFFGVVFRAWHGVRLTPGLAWSFASTVHDVPWDYERGCAR
jgi:hypothetical protein